MAITVLTATTQASAINYTYRTSGSTDWSSVPSSTYFYDLVDKLPHYKDSSGTVQEVFSPSFSGVTSLNVSTGLSANTTTGNINIINTSPDQTVVLNAGTGISTSGTYPNFTITNTSTASGVTLTSAGGTVSLVNDGTGPALANKGLTSSTGISLTDGGTQVTITNTAPDQTVVLNNGSNINISGSYPNFTINTTGLLPSTGNTSGDCITDLYVSNIHSCSPLNINPNDEGNVYFGSNSGITLDLANDRLGIGTSSPEYSLDILDTNSRVYYDPNSVGGRFSISGNTGVPRLDVVTSGFGSRIGAGGAWGMRTWDDTSYPGYGKVGDMFVYAGNETYGLNFINPPGTNQGTRPTEDYIRFYAGQLATGTADIHIQGSGSTKGFVGIGTETPTDRLTVNGKTKTTNLQVTNGATNGYVLTSDASGNASWQASSGGVSIDPYNNVGNVNTITWDVSGTSTNYQATLTGNTTLSLTNVRNGDYGTIILTQDGVGGRTLTFGNINGAAGTHRVVNGGGGTPTLTSNANAIDILTFTYNGSVMYWTVGNDYN